MPNNKYIKFIKKRNKYYFLLALSFLVTACEFENVKPTAGNGNKITISTSGATDITQYTAQVAGTLGEIFGRVVQDYGHCWGTSSEPDLSGDYTSFGSVDESLIFNSTLNNLTINTIYYARAYFIIDDIVLYGNETTFSTLEPTVPSVQTVEVKKITSTTAECECFVADDGGAPVFQRGVCFDTVPNPNVTGNRHTINGTGEGSFTAYISGLAENTTYYIRAYAKNSVGIAYGTEISFKTTTGDN